MSNQIEIKVCGINDEISMNTAIKCKADYIGLVFYKNSPRNITINLSRKLIKLRNKVSRIVALTVNPDNEFLFEIKSAELSVSCLAASGYELLNVYCNPSL